MSMYTTMSLKFKPAIPISKEDTDRIVDILELNEFIVSSELIDISVRYNYGIDKISTLLSLLEKFIPNNHECVKIGEFDTENYQVFSYDDSEVYMYRGFLFIINSESQTNYFHPSTECITITDKLFNKLESYEEPNFDISTIIKCADKYINFRVGEANAISQTQLSE